MPAGKYWLRTYAELMLLLSSKRMDWRRATLRSIMMQCWSQRLEHRVWGLGGKQNQNQTKSKSTTKSPITTTGRLPLRTHQHDPYTRREGWASTKKGRGSSSSSCSLFQLFVVIRSLQIFPFPISQTSSPPAARGGSQTTNLGVHWLTCFIMFNIYSGM